MDVNERIVSWFYGLLDEPNTRLFWSSAALSDVTFRTGTNNICPNGLSAHTARYNVVKRQLAGWPALAAILTFVFIASKDISAIKFHFTSR